MRSKTAVLFIVAACTIGCTRQRSIPVFSSHIEIRRDAPSQNIAVAVVDVKSGNPAPVPRVTITVSKSWSGDWTVARRTGPLVLKPEENLTLRVPIPIEGADLHVQVEVTQAEAPGVLSRSQAEGPIR